MSKVLKSSLFLLLALGGAFFLTSCDEDSLQEQTLIDVTTEDELPELVEASLLPPPTDPNNPEPEALRTPCFRFVYPVSLVLRDGTVLEAGSGADLRVFIQRIRNNGLRANFVYPFDVELANGETISILRFGEFRRLRNFCNSRDNAFDEPCFRYNYPIEVSINQSTVSINSALAWRIALRAAARGAAVRINYPISVTLSGEEEPTIIESRAEHNELRRSCGNGEGDREPCFRFVYPLDLTVGEEIVTVDSPAEWRATVIESGSEVQVRPAYPLDVTIQETAEVVTVTAAEGWAAVRELCN